jgi:hypothetical protein
MFSGRGERLPAETVRDVSTSLDMTKNEDEYAKALRGKRHFKDETV